MAPMMTYPVKSPVLADRRYEPGETIDLDDKAAKELIACGALGEATGEAKTVKQQLNVADTVKLVNAAATIEELEQLAVNENSLAQPRKGVTDAIEARRAALTA